MCRPGNQHFDVRLLPNRPVLLRPIQEEMDGKVIHVRQSWHFFLAYSMNKVLFPYCTLDWRVNDNVSRQ